MNVQLKRGCAALPSDIEQLEREIGGVLPNSYLDFSRQYDGAQPDANIFKVGGTNESGVNRFIPIREVTAERAHIENLPSTAFPFAWAEGGNCVVIDAASGAIYFWDHEQPTQPVQIASDFAAFIARLEPSDPSSKLNPDQVKSAWIDPDFLKSLDQ